MSANWFDHAIATVAPRAAARRVMARQAFETLTRGYDGAAKGRRTEGWRAPGTSADTEVGVAGALCATGCAIWCATTRMRRKLWRCS